MSVVTNSNPGFSEATLKRFAFEVAKYPRDQAQSAVMACLAKIGRAHV